MQVEKLANCLLNSYALLHPISGHNQVNDHLPEVVFFCAVISIVWNYVKRHDAIFFIQSCFKIRERFLFHTYS